MIAVKNPVHAALLLVLCFFTTAALWLLLQAEFLAIVLVLVYVGAVMVLFLFVVMMLDIKIEPMREGFMRYLPLGALVAVVMLAEMLGADRHPRDCGDAACRPRRPFQHRLAGTGAVYPFPAAVRDRRGDPDRRRRSPPSCSPCAVARTCTQPESRRSRCGQGQRTRPHRQDAQRCESRSPRQEPSLVNHARPFPRARRGAVLHCRRRHLHQPQERDRAADVHRADAARGEHEFRRVLALSRRCGRAGVRVLHPDGGGGRVGDRSGDPGGAVPQPRDDQRRRDR